MKPKSQRALTIDEKKIKEKFLTPKKNYQKSQMKSVLQKNKSFTQEEKIELVELKELGFDKNSSMIPIEWLERISLCSRYQKSEDEMTESGFLNYTKDLLGISDKKSKALKNLRNSKFHKFVDKFEPLKEVEFHIIQFDLDKFLIEDQKMNLMTKEIAILNLMNSVVQALSLCYLMKLPHGNISPQTIFKKSKFEWEISPPMFSNINLEKRSKSFEKTLSMKSRELSVEFCMAPEILDHLNLIKKRKSNK